MPQPTDPTKAKALLLAVHHTEDTLPEPNELVMTDRGEMYLGVTGQWLLDEFIPVPVDPPAWWAYLPGTKGTFLDEQEARDLITAMGEAMDENIQNLDEYGRFESLHEKLAMELPPKHLWGH